MRRFSIATLMVVVLACGVALAALHTASEDWAGAILMLTLSFLGTSLLGWMIRKESKRAFWAGFAIFGCAYMLIEFVPKLWDQAVDPLPTGRLLYEIHSKVVPSGVPVFDVGAGEKINISGRSYVGIGDGRFVDQGSAASSHLLRLALPGAANYEPFLRIGHCLFALLAGLIGGGIAR
jgi:hypothetical protein